ncbi:MAG: hypothetical protein L6R39_005841 [Caloplaca ligustica]|nr:MAG: hypothetical protein L6R39_005841 [Caloplaca ligustica]
MLLCFPTTPEVDRSDVIISLQHAAAALLETIPILGGQVVNQKDDNVEVPNSGTFQVVPYRHPDHSALRVKVLDDFVSYEQLSRSKAPASMLDASVTAPMEGFPHHYGASDVTPVLIVQANFIPGGLLLCFAGMHNCMDGTGLGQVIRMFATLCRGEQLSREEVEAANLDRAQLPVSLKAGQSPMPHPEMTVKANADQKTDPGNITTSVWSYFTIPASKLNTLKVEGSKQITSGWVSTNDVVNAWLWKAVTRARWPHIDVEKATTLLRAINGRRALDPPLPAQYLGANVMCAYPRFTVTDLIQQPLSEITQEVRRATNAVNDHYVRSVATLIRMEPDRNKISFVIDAPDRDLLVSSWAALPVYEDFGGLLGRPEYVRRPTSPPWTGVCYMMPKHPDGSLALVLSLREDDMHRLRSDKEFAAFAEYIG